MKSQSLFVVGINHLTAPVSCRERSAVLQDRIGEVLSHLTDFADLKEAAVLSTCSRTEVYAVGEGPESAELVWAWFLRRAGAEVEPGLYLKQGPEAVRHLFRVAGGLDSWIVGETEILGQVRKAYQAALEAKATGRILNQAFQRALAAGKVLRSQTGIQNGIRSIGGAAALLAKRIFSESVPGRVVVFGAGEAAEAVARHLAAKNFKEIWVANRTLDRALAVAGPLGGRAVSFEEGIQKLSEAEAAVFSTACPKVLLEASILRPLLANRRRPLFLIDLGLPRNVDPACGRLPGVYLYNLDDLKGIVRESMAAKASEKERAEVLSALAAAECVEELERSEILRSRVLPAAGRVP